MSRAKQKSLLFLSVAGVCAILLAMSIPGLVLSPGQPFSLGQSSPEVPGGSSSLPGGDLLMHFFQGLLALALILFPVYVLFALLSAEGRQRLLADVIVIVLLLLAADYLHNLPREESANQQDQQIGVSLDWGQFTNSNPVVDFPADPPEWLTPAVIFVVSTLVVVFMGSIVWGIRRRRKSPKFAYEELAEEAEKTIISIHAGGDFKMTIIRCYQEMSWVLWEERGIAREKFMTPREFEARLLDKGLPQESVSALTRLFEQVRYSAIPAGTQDKNLALSCLTDIVDTCKAMGDGHAIQ